VFDIYKCNKLDSCRFTLGKSGLKKVFVVGLNPSTANKENSDPTVTRVQKVSENYEYDGFVMLNLYPLRSTDPKKLPLQADTELIKENISEIVSVVGDESSPVFWAAWGSDISSREYLKDALRQLDAAVEIIGGKWVNYGDLTTKKHPRHPSRLSYTWGFSDFDMDEYLNIIT